MKGIDGDAINFVVPDRKTFMNIDSVEGLGSDLKPGLIEAMLNLFGPGTVVKLELWVVKS